MDSKENNYVLYDGDCGFCNRSVAFILKHESSSAIHFAPIQSTYTKELFKKNNWEEPNLSTFYFIQDGKKLERSAAAFEVLKYLKSPVRWLRIFRFIPRKITDWIYDQVAKRRQRISKGFCVMPTPDQRTRFVLV
ncbi:MAG: DCC1-like thiol-disulfide oxidoreductase family protein [Crocinitomicaceae bacterium]|nr:DCC1-like thiol-disulfide oxidoreductase family protein [Crocinitomicaceae bacterium]